MPILSSFSGLHFKRVFRKIRRRVVKDSTLTTIFLLQQKLLVDNLSKDEIHAFVRDIGFHRKPRRKDPDPEEYKDGTVPPPDGTTAQQLKQGTSKWSQYGEIVEPMPAERVLPLDRMKDTSLKARIMALLEGMRTRQKDREDL